MVINNFYILSIYKVKFVYVSILAFKFDTYMVMSDSRNLFT